MGATATVKKSTDGPPPDDGSGGNGNTPGGPPNGGGNGGAENGGPSDGYLGWNMGRETSRMSNGNALTTVAVGTNGFTVSVAHPTEGWAKTTGHLDGTLHRHGYMSDQAPKDDFVQSNAPYEATLGKVIGRSKPEPR
jgi:hypothetical protein